MSRGSWTHSVCGECWILQSLDKPERCLYDEKFVVGVMLPVRLVNPTPTDICCYCGNSTKLGAYVRADPTTLKCNGAHP